MKLLIEDIDFSLDDIIDQLKETFGFIYIENDDTSGYIMLSAKVKLSLQFNDDLTRLESAVLDLPESSIDLVDSPATADTYSSCIESSQECIDLINRMLENRKEGEVEDEEDN